MITFLKSYIRELRKEFYLKEYEIINNSHRQIFTNKENNSFISLRDIFKKQHFIKRSLIQNEIDSINQVGKDKFVIFHTSTLDPILNLNQKIKDIDTIEEQITKQYKEFSKYHKYINDTNDKKKLRYKNIRVYEFTKKFNLHCHKTDFLNNEEDFIKYIESIILSRNKNNIGRIELVLNIDFFKVVEQFFKDKKIKIRINNKYIYLSLIKKTITFKNEKQDIFIIKETIKEKGNFIYIRTINDIKEDNEHLTNYMFKYMLKSFDINKENEILKPRSNVSKETLIFSKLKLRQKIYSINFFTDKMTKDELEKINGKIFTLFKQLDNNKKNVLSEFNENDFNELKNGKNHLFYTLSNMLRDGKLYKREKTEILLTEYKKIKHLIRMNIEEYDEKRKKNFLFLIYKKYIHTETMTEAEFNEQFFNELNEHIKQNNDFKRFIKVYNDIYGIETIEDIETNETDVIESYMDNELIEQLTKKIFPFFFNKYRYEDNEKELIYYNNENGEMSLFHTFKSDYVFEKFYNDIELYDNLLTEKEFNNDNDRLKTSIDYINSITETLNLDIELLTIDKVKEDEERERIERRKKENERISIIMDNIEEDYNDLIKYYYSLNYYQKIEFIEKNDEHIKQKCNIQ